MFPGKAYLVLILCTVVLVITDCAKQASPAGGPKDVTPPVMVKSYPEPGTTMFRDKSIAITFNEYFTLDKLNEKFLISPPLKDKPKINVKGKNLMIEFKGNLKDSTTYTLNFPEVIRDLNEGNPIPNFQFVFSTGKTLDSLSVTGNVVMAENLEAGKNILVMLYSSRADSAPRKMLPDYLTIADENGYFRINNVRAGRYRLYALEDANSNNRYDAQGEKFAFLDSAITVDPLNDYRPVIPPPPDTIKILKKTAKGAEADKTPKYIPFYFGDHKLYMFTAEKTARYLTSSDRKMAYQLMYYLSLPPDTMKFGIRFADQGKFSFLTERSRNRDTLTVWLRDSSLYTKPLIKTVITYPFTDSTGKIIYKEDTLQMRYTAPRTRGKQAAKSLKISDNTLGGNLKPGSRIVYSSPTPFRPPDTSRIRLFHIKEKEKNPVPVSFSPDSANSRVYYLNNKFIEGERYQLVLNKGAFGNIYGEQSDSSGLNIFVRKPDTYGHLTMDISSGMGSLIIQLLDSKENIVEQRRVPGSGAADFPLLERGTYRVRAIYDLNGDGKWTTGNFDRNKQPEPVSYFPREIEVKSDWEIVEEWDVASPHQKDQALREKRQVGK